MKTQKFLLGLIVAALMLVTSCSQSTPGPQQNKGSSSSPVTEATNTNLGPTGSSDPITGDDVNMNEDVGFYDEADPSDDPVLPGTAYSACGTVYRQFNNPVIYFRNDANQLFFMQEFSYDSVTFLRNIRFTRDSFTACLEGYRNGSNFYLNTVTSQSATEHPLKTQKANFSHELCGQLAYVTNAVGNTTLNLQVSNLYYLIDDSGIMDGLPGVVPTTTSSITTQTSIEACLYSNKASFYNYNESFKPQFEIEGYDFGALNP